MALRYFRQIDLADTHVAIDGGVHIAALGGIGLTAVFGFAGLSLHQRRSRDSRLGSSRPSNASKQRWKQESR
jgi:trehalose/maltose hydrolase-like predicted phosphorylase